jgi:hypothetical protein
MPIQIMDYIVKCSPFLQPVNNFPKCTHTIDDKKCKGEFLCPVQMIPSSF